MLGTRNQIGINFLYELKNSNLYFSTQKDGIEKDNKMYIKKSYYLGSKKFIQVKIGSDLCLNQNGF